MIFSQSAFAKIETTLKGNIEVVPFNEPVIFVYGEPAKAMWEEMTEVQPVKYGEMGEYLMKLGQSYSCHAEYSSLFCMIKLKDLKKGVIAH
jgi:hypothetical protein